MENLENEIWKDIKGYEGLYQVSNLGRIKSLDRIIVYPNNMSSRFFKSKIQKPCLNSNGYLFCDLYKNSNRKRFYIHRLVLTSFIGLEKGKDVNHINGIKTDNKLSNLEWLTRSENMKHAFKIGLCENTIANCLTGNNKKGK